MGARLASKPLSFPLFFLLGVSATDILFSSFLVSCGDPLARLQTFARLQDRAR